MISALGMEDFRNCQLGKGTEQDGRAPMGERADLYFCIGISQIEFLARPKLLLDLISIIWLPHLNIF